MIKFEKKFFATHKVPQMSAANLYFFSIDESIPELFEQFDLIAKEKGFNFRNYSEEADEIRSLTDPQTIVNYMRKANAMVNRVELVKKITEYAETTMPLIVKRYLTSGLDEVIEISGHCFIKNDLKYLSELKSRYFEIRNPYAKAVACLDFAICGLETDGDFLFQEYVKFQRMYPNENFHEFPLLGLHILYEDNKL